MINNVNIMTGLHCCSIGTGKVRLNLSDGVALTGLKRFRVSMRKMAVLK